MPFRCNADFPHRPQLEYLVVVVCGNDVDDCRQCRDVAAFYVVRLDAQKGCQYG
jgi:hypothetical protein